MAFDKNLWARVSLSFNTGHSIDGTGSANIGAPSIFTYSSPTDNIATISAQDYFSPIAVDIKAGDLIYIFATNGSAQVRVVSVVYISGAPTVSVTAVIGATGVTNPTGGRTNYIPQFSDNTGQVIEDSGVYINPILPLLTHTNRMLRRKTFLADPLLQLTGLSAIQFTQGVGTIYVDGLTGMQFIDNDFGSDTQVCTLITGELPGSSSSPSALFELQSTTGALLVSRMSTSQINALTFAQDGSIVYDNTIKRMKFKEDGVWNVGVDGSGTVTSITIGAGLGGANNPIVTDGDIFIADTAVEPGTYTNATFTVGSTGQLDFAESGPAPVLSVTGTTDMIDSTGGANPVLSLSAIGTPTTYTYPSILIIDAQGRVTGGTSGPSPVDGILTITGTAGRISVTSGQNPIIDLINTGVTAGTYTNVGSLTMLADGRVSAITSGTAPSATAKYIVQTTDGSLPNAQSLGGISTGIVFNTVTAGVGVLRMAVADADYASVSSVTLAQSTATNAQTSANTANTTAGNAQASANAASTAANNAQTAATAAQATAVSAITIAAAAGTTAAGAASSAATAVVGAAAAAATAASALGLATALALEKYIIQEANVTTPNAQSLGALATGIVKNTTTAGVGVLSRAIPDTDYASVNSTTDTRAFKFILAAFDGFAPNAQSLGDLPSGLVKSTVSGFTSTVSTAVPGVDYVIPAALTNVSDATYITQVPSAYLPNSQALSLLGGGLLKNTTGTGVLEDAVPGVDYYSPNFPTVIQEGPASSDFMTMGIGAGAVFTGSVFNTMAFGKEAFGIATTLDHGTAFGRRAGSTQVTYTGATFFGDSADASVNGLSNIAAFGYLASVAVSNAVVLGNNCSVGIAQSSPLYGLDIGTSSNVTPQIRLKSSLPPSLPPGATEGIYSVWNGKPIFTGGTSPYNGKIVLARRTGTDALCGTATLNGTTAVTISTTAVFASSILFCTHNNGTATVSSTNLGTIGIGTIVNGTSFQIVSDNPLDTGTVNWIVINP